MGAKKSQYSRHVSVLTSRTLLWSSILIVTIRRETQLNVSFFEGITECLQFCLCVASECRKIVWLFEFLYFCVIICVNLCAKIHNLAILAHTAKCLSKLPNVDFVHYDCLDSWLSNVRFAWCPTNASWKDLSLPKSSVKYLSGQNNFDSHEDIFNPRSSGMSGKIIPTMKQVSC